MRMAKCTAAQSDPPVSAHQEEIKALVERSGAVRHGHFRLASGRHSDTYVEKFRILERPDLLAEVCSDIAAHFRADRPEVIAGPSTGGMLVAYELARQLEVPAVYVETDADNRRVLKRGAQIEPGARVLLVDDVLTTGVSLQEVLSLLEKARADLVGIGVLIDRSEGVLDFPGPLYAACRFEARSFGENEVPPWLAALPLDTPGTRARRAL